MPATPATRSGPARLSVMDTLRVTRGVLAPLIARGVIVRRPRMVAMAQRMDADRRAVELLAALRGRHGSGPLVLRVPGRTMAVVIDPDDARRVLAGTPDPFRAATREKRAALRHFQPHAVLISDGEMRQRRRVLNESVLRPDLPVHHLGTHVVEVIDREVDALCASTERSGTLDWDAFVVALQRIIRRIVLGDRARDDHEVTDLLVGLRADANWAFLRPRRNRRRERFEQVLQRYLAEPEPGSLVHLLASADPDDALRPEEQVPHWMFAFDATVWATYRALGLLSTHPEVLERAGDEVAPVDGTGPRPLTYLRACVLESLRLWPTTPAILRDTTALTSWGDGELPEGTSLMIYAPFLHRDPAGLDDADRFTPEVWFRPDVVAARSLVPFSDGPGVCPGRNLVLLVASTVLAAVLGRVDLSMVDPGPMLDRDHLPGTLDPFSLRFGVLPRRSGDSGSVGGAGDTLDLGDRGPLVEAAHPQDVHRTGAHL
jgi:cytochrome P450